MTDGAILVLSLLAGAAVQRSGATRLKRNEVIQ